METKKEIINIIVLLNLYDWEVIYESRKNAFS